MKNFTNKDGSNWVFDGDYKEMFGLPRKAKWPSDGMLKREIQGIMCWVTPSYAIGPNSKKHRFYMRAFCECPTCGKVLSMGRLAQHNKVHK